MVAAILLGFVLVLILYLLFVPMVLYLNTDKKQYYLQLRGLAKANIEGHKEEIIRIRLKIFFWNFYFYPLKKISLSRRKKIEKNKVSKPRQRIGFRKIIRLLKSFKVRKIFVNIDTGNYITNAKLYPLFVFLNHYKRGFNINFEGRNQMVLYMQNRPIYIIKSFINI